MEYFNNYRKSLNYTYLYKLPKSYNMEREYFNNKDYFAIELLILYIPTQSREITFAKFCNKLRIETNVISDICRRF